MIVIADTGPLSYLIRIGEIEVLPALYGHIVVPVAVSEELKHSDAPASVSHWIAQPPIWLEIRAPEGTADAELVRANLDGGERDAILLAQELGADELIIDDMDGRREAKRRKLHFVGTLGVLRLAADKGLLDFKEAIDRLLRTNFYVAQEVLDVFMRNQGD